MAYRTLGGRKKKGGETMGETNGTLLKPKTNGGLKWLREHANIALLLIDDVKRTAGRWTCDTDTAVAVELSKMSEPAGVTISHKSVEAFRYENGRKSFERQHHKATEIPRRWTAEEIKAECKMRRPDVEFAIGDSGWGDSVVSVKGHMVPAIGLSESGEGYSVRPFATDRLVHFSGNCNSTDDAITAFIAEVDKSLAAKPATDYPEEPETPHFVVKAQTSIGTPPPTSITATSITATCNANPIAAELRQIRSLLAEYVECMKQGGKVQALTNKMLLDRMPDVANGVICEPAITDQINAGDTVTFFANGKYDVHRKREGDSPCPTKAQAGTTEDPSE